MVTRCTSWAYVAAVVLLTGVSTATAKYSGGTGEPNDPYQIATAADLIALGETPADYGKHFILTADIDLDPRFHGRKVFDKAVIAPDTSDVTRSFEGSPFAGVFNGNRHKVSNLTIQGGSYLGLFGRLALGGEVRNLGVTDVRVTGSGSYVGGLTGVNGDVWESLTPNGAVWQTSTSEGGRVSQCYSTGVVSGHRHVGGLVGFNVGAVTQCWHSTGGVTGNLFTGGLLGSNYSSVSNCYSNCGVNGGSYVGGLIGSVNDGDVWNCYSAGTVSGTSNKGGLVGSDVLRRVVDVDCFWDKRTIPTLVGTQNTGGTPLSTAQMQTAKTFLDAGWDFVDESKNGTEDIWWIVEGKDYPRLWFESGGPLLASNPDPTDRSTHVSASTILSWTPAGPALLHDIYLGEDLAAVATATPASAGIYRGRQPAGTTTYAPGNLMWGQTYYWRIDEVNEADHRGPWRGKVWSFTTGPNVAYAYGGGSGTADDPYQIAAAVDLIALGVSPEDYDKQFVLTADIDLDPNLPDRRVFDKAVIAPGWTTPFTGILDGKGYTIKNLKVTGRDNLGLFGVLGSTARVSNLGLEAVEVSGTGWQAGGLVGSNLGSIVECYSSGSVSGTYSVGGLVGDNGGSIAASYSAGSIHGQTNVGGLVGSNGGSITTTYSNGAVTGTQWVGGLVGENRGSVNSSYSSGSVSGKSDVGGLVGGNWGSITNSYGTGSVSGTESVGGLVGFNLRQWSGGPVGTASSSFWDMQTSGQTKSAGGTGKTTAEMQTASTFLDAGWDFVGETANGTEDIWKIAEGLDYPLLWWEQYDGQITLELGQMFTVTLESNPSTGYRWEWVDNQDSIVEQVGEAEFKPRETGHPPLVGAGGWESFNFKAVSQGQMTLKLVYRRPWEEGVEPLKTFSLQVAVP